MASHPLPDQYRAMTKIKLMAPSYRDHNISTYLPDTLLGGKKGNKANTKKQVLIQKNHRELRNK